MKITQQAAGFSPVTVVFESKEEVVMAAAALADVTRRQVECAAERLYNSNPAGMPDAHYQLYDKLDDVAKGKRIECAD